VPPKSRLALNALDPKADERFIRLCLRKVSTAVKAAIRKEQVQQSAHQSGQRSRAALLWLSIKEDVQEQEEAESLAAENAEYKRLNRYKSFGLDRYEGPINYPDTTPEKLVFDRVTYDYGCGVWMRPREGYKDTFSRGVDPLDRVTPEYSFDVMTGVRYLSVGVATHQNQTLWKESSLLNRTGLGRVFEYWCAECKAYLAKDHNCATCSKKCSDGHDCTPAAKSTPLPAVSVLGPIKESQRTNEAKERKLQAYGEMNPELKPYIGGNLAKLCRMPEKIATKMIVREKYKILAQRRIEARKLLKR